MYESSSIRSCITMEYKIFHGFAGQLKGKKVGVNWIIMISYSSPMIIILCIYIWHKCSASTSHMSLSLSITHFSLPEINDNPNVSVHISNRTHKKLVHSAITCFDWLKLCQFLLLYSPDRFFLNSILVQISFCIAITIKAGYMSLNINVHVITLSFAIVTIGCKYQFPEKCCEIDKNVSHNVRINGKVTPQKKAKKQHMSMKMHCT